MQFVPVELLGIFFFFTFGNKSTYDSKYCSICLPICEKELFCILLYIQLELHESPENSTKQRSQPYELSLAKGDLGRKCGKVLHA